MPKINTIAIVPVPKLSDKLVGTSVGGTPVNQTNNFTLQQLKTLFDGAPVSPNLQAVLNAGNTATQNIYLTGTIDTVNLDVSNDSFLKNLYLSERLFDRNNFQGTNGQYLTSTGTGVQWSTLTIATPTLQQVLTAGNISDKNIITTGNIQAANIEGTNITANTNLRVVGTLSDSSNSVGGSGQVLSSTVTGTDWIDFPSYSAVSPLIYNNVLKQFSIQVATSTQNGYLSSADWITFNGKQNAGNYITALTGEASALGPGSVNITLNNLAVINKTLTGLAISSGVITAADSIITAFGKIQGQINGIVAGVVYQGVWNAATNTPTLTSSVGVQGHYYVVDVAGNTNLNGITDWQVGDWAIYNGTAWQKVDNTDSVTSVNGQTGIVVLNSDNIAEGTTNLYYLDSRARAAISSVATGLTYTSATGVFSLTAGYSIPTVANQTNWTTAYNDSIVSAAVTGTTTKTLTLTQQDGGTITASWTDIDTNLVTSVFGRTGAVVAQAGDYSTTLVTEGTNLYYLDSRARSAISSSATGLTYTTATGVFSFTAGYSIPTDASQSNWTTAYNDSITSAAVTGTTTKTLTLNQQDGGTITASWTDLDTGLTSVGVSMPSAFNVTNSPLTSNGTIAVTGAGTAAQYVRGDGTLGDFPTGGGGGGASVSYYLNGSINQGTFGGNTYYQMSKTPILGAGTDFSTSTNGYIAQFITDVGTPDALLIPGGNWNFETYFSASSGGGSPTFYIELYKYDGATFTLIASNSSNPELIAFGTTINPYYNSLAVPETILLATDRLAIRIYVFTSGRTINLHTEDNHLCQAITTFTTGLTALNGLTKQIQYFSVGTSGTDFNISSSVATHTFNLPTASAVNRGALSSSDWSTFNAKQNALTLTTSGSSGPATLIGATLNIPDYGSALSGYVPYTGASQAVNLGIYSLSAGSLFVNGPAPTSGSYLGFKQATSVTTGGGGYTSISTFGTSQMNFSFAQPSGFKEFKFDVSSITTGVPGGRVYTMPDADGTIALVGGSGVGTVTSVAALTLGTSGTDLSSTVANSTTTPVITLNVPTASATNRGALSAADWSTFNNKQNAITLTTTGTSGAATLVGSTLNIPQYQSVLTNPITGTGTTNYLPKFTGSTTIGNSLLIDDGNKINLTTTNTSISSLNIDSASLDHISMQSNRFHLIGSSNFHITNNAYYDLAFKYALTGVATKLTIQSDGSFVFDNSTSGTAGTAVTWINRFSINSSGAGTFSSSVTANGTIRITRPADTSQYIDIYPSGGEGFIDAVNSLAGTSQALIFRNGNSGGITERMRITSSGNLLVGTTTDNGARLQVSGTSTFGGRLLVSHATSGNYGAVIYNTSATGEGLVVRGGSTSSHSAFVVQPYDGSVSLFNVLSTGAATFSSSVTAANFNAVSSNAFIIINDTSGNAAGQFQFQNNGIQKWNFATQATSNDLGLYNNGGTNSFNLYIKHSTGNVGIGTSSPTNGLLVINSTAANGVRFALESSGTMNGIVALGNNAISGLSTTDMALWTRGVMAFETGASGEKMRITSGGNVLIGTTTDFTFLGITSLNVDRNFNSGHNIRISNQANNSSASANLILGTFGNSWVNGLGSNSSTLGNNLYWAVDASTSPLQYKMVLTTSGNLLIGTTTDNGARLQVSGDARVSGILTSGSTTIGNINSKSLLIGTDGTETNYRYQFYLSSNNLLLYSRGYGDLLTVNYTTGAATFSSKVGVGGAAATYSLTAYNASNGTTAAFGGTARGIRIDNDGTFSSGRSTIFGVDSSFYGSYQPLSIEASSIALQAVTGGNVGIGYNSPTYQLQVLNTIGLRANSTSFQAIKGTYWGYSTSYPVVMLGDSNTANFTTVSIGYDPSANANGAFSGDGREVLFRRGAQFVTPNAANNAFNLYNLVLLDGNVGIGTSSPAVSLEVNGRYRTTSSFASSGTTVHEIYNASSSGFGAYIGAGSGTNYSFRVADYLNNPLFTVNGNGNVLIGTTTDNGSRFQVTGPNTGALPLVNLVASGTGTFQRGVRLLNSGMNAGDHIMMSVGQADSARNMGQFYFQYNGAGSTSNRVSIGLHSVDDVLNVLGTGNVGIGTTSFSNAISGTERILQIANSNVASLYLNSTSTGRNYALYSSATGNFVIYDTSVGVSRMSISTAGNISAGGGLNSTFTFQNDGTFTGGSGSGSAIRLDYGNQTIAQLSNTGTGQRDAVFSLRDENTVRVNIAANNSRGGATYFNGGGNVLIGTTTDVGARLYVDGAFRTGTLTAGTQTAAVDWRLGNARGGAATNNALIRVQINGVLVDLLGNYV